MEVKQIRFQFKGTRNYIQGPDIFNSILVTYAGETSVTNIRFSVHGFVYNQLCQLYVANNKEALSTVANVRARCQFDKNSNTQWMALTENETKSVLNERYEYDENQIISLCQLNKESITLTQKSPFTFIETVVAMNKHLHQQLFPEVDGKWVFTRIDLDTLCDQRENLVLRFMHNMNYRLTKTDVLVNGKKLGDIFFSLVKS